MKPFVVLLLGLCLDANANMPAVSGEATKNPQKYVLDHATSPEQGLTQFDCAECSAMKDLLFISATKECSNEGCFFYVFKKDGTSFKFQTTLFLKADAFQFLESQHNGWNDILTYQQTGTDKGFLTQLHFEGQNYVSPAKNKILKNEDPKMHLRPEVVKVLRYTKDLNLLQTAK